MQYSSYNPLLLLHTRTLTALLSTEVTVFCTVSVKAKEAEISIKAHLCGKQSS